MRLGYHCFGARGSEPAAPDCDPQTLLDLCAHLVLRLHAVLHARRLHLRGVVHGHRRVARGQAARLVVSAVLRRAQVLRRRHPPRAPGDRLRLRLVMLRLVGDRPGVGVRVVAHQRRRRRRRLLHGTDAGEVRSCRCQLPGNSVGYMPLSCDTVDPGFTLDRVFNGG